MSATTRFILAKISPLKYMVTITSLWVGLTIPFLVFDEVEYRFSGIILALASLSVLFALKKLSVKWLKLASFWAFMVWLFISIFAVADGYWEAALWLTFPNVLYFAYIYIFAAIKLDYILDRHLYSED
jgi:hypothetical protein